jgi:hypothetical protein
LGKQIQADLKQILKAKSLSGEVDVISCEEFGLVSIWRLKHKNYEFQASVLNPPSFQKKS